MQLSDIICEEAICTAVQVESKEEAVRVLLLRLVEAGKLAAEQLEPVLRAVLEREALGSTAIGRGVAVPHARVRGIERTVMAVGLSDTGVQFDALDGEAVHALFLIIGPDKDADDYLAALEKISRLIHNRDFRRFLSLTRTGREALELIAEMDA